VIGNILDRYLLREWLKIFIATAVGFPLVVIILEITDNLPEYLGRGITTSAIMLAQVYSLPENIFRVFPAAVLFATVFSIGSMNRHSELTAAKASGRSFHRMVVPIFIVSVFAAAASLAIGELAPAATMRKLELLGELEVRATNTRQNFVYRAEEGWVYTIRSLNIRQRQVHDLVLEREGSGSDYPTLVVNARAGRFDDSTRTWTLRDGRSRMLTETMGESTVQFDSLRLSSLTETPADLLSEPLKPEQMDYAELGRYIEALERSGGDGRKLRVFRALKIAVPITCIIIALFGAPLAVAAPRASGAFGIAASLVTTMVFLLLVQLSQAVGAGGILPPGIAAWTPNAAFAIAGVVLLSRAPT
jgi:lipopolysaccharide export system permease protein